MQNYIKSGCWKKPSLSRTSHCASDRAAKASWTARPPIPWPLPIFPASSLRSARWPRHSTCTGFRTSWTLVPLHSGPQTTVGFALAPHAWSPTLPFDLQDPGNYSFFLRATTKSQMLIHMSVCHQMGVSRKQTSSLCMVPGTSLWTALRSI